MAFIQIVVSIFLSCLELWHGPQRNEKVKKFLFSVGKKAQKG